MGVLEDEALVRTLSEDELARTLELTPEGFARISMTVAQSPGSTIEPAREGGSTTGARALATLKDTPAERVLEGALEVGATIGEGGMGVVRTAMQRSLGRRVAVKTLRAEAKSTDATLRLLREAWVTGALEHPNIVPVYDLGLDASGSPLIVMKQIEGRPWSELISESDLEQNLRILVQLCNAVSLAHSRAILHRDLKPDNVMVGRFGEVYLVDWGLAVSLVEDPSGRLPRASDAKELAGTPAYMAPEMLGGGRLDERTDVYLLGAILHEILVARPPHSGESFREIVASILRSTPSFPDGVPPQLAAIATRALGRKPEERFASAEELRDRLEWYLRHRGSLALSTEAARSVETLRAVLAESDGAEGIRERVHRLFAEARFGFRQALNASGDNAEASKGLRDVSELVAGFELDQGMPEAAAAALAEIDSPSPELAARVSEAMRRRDDEKARMARLEKLSADLDPTIGRRTRMVVASMLGLFWTVAPLGYGVLYRRYDPVPRWGFYGVTALAGAVAVGFIWWGRETLLKTAVNRRTTAAMLMLFATQFVLQLGGNVLGIAMLDLAVLHLFVWFVSALGFAFYLERTLLPSAIGFGVAFLCACYMRDSVWTFMALANVVLTGNVLRGWLRPREDGGFFVERMRERIEGRRRG